jgi:hypothetical protein
MPSHFSTIGFSLASQDDFAALAQQLAAEAEPISTKAGQYLRWKGIAGEEVWLQIDRGNDLIGMNPHFVGRSSVAVRVDARVQRPTDTALDGAFHGWSAPDGGDGGAYPFVFDSPDAATYVTLRPPQVVDVQVAAFAHEIAFYDSPEAFGASQGDEKVKFASQSFIPSGLFAPDGGTTDPPEALAIFTGHVNETAVHKNSITGATFYWALVETLGGLFDVVIDSTLLPAAPSRGGVLSGQFWLSGRILSLPPAKRTWFGRLIGGAG